MSYRDLRNISEFLRRVGYPRIVSLENFRNPNFQLVADIGLWLVKQYDPMAASDFPSEIGTDRERVRFITSFSEFMLTKVQVKLNMKRLYQADGYAVKELIKVVSILFMAMKDAENAGDGESSTKDAAETSVDFSINVEDLRKTRSLASDITQRGVTLYDMLQKEIGLREARYTALSKAFELSEVERLLQAALASAESELKKSIQLLDSLDSNFNTVTLKLEKKTQELERNEKRLQTLKKVRPAFMDEYEKLQSELEAGYREYVIRFRVLAHMQNQMEEMSKLDAERKAEERLIKQELGMGSTDDLLHFGGGTRAGEITASDDDSDVDEDSAHRNAKEFLASRPKVKRPQGTAKNQLSLGSRGKIDRFEEDGLRSRAGKPPRQIYGSMLGGGNESGDSESDLILMDGDNADDNSDLGSDDVEDDEEIAPMRPLQGRALPNKLQEHMLRQEMQHSASMNILNGNGEMVNGSSALAGLSTRPITSDRFSDEGFRRLELQSQSQARTTVSVANGGVKKRPPELNDDDENGLDDEDEEDLLIKPLQAPARVMSKSKMSGRSRSLQSTSSSGSGGSYQPGVSGMGNGKSRDVKSRTKLGRSDTEETVASKQPNIRPGSSNRHLPTVSDDDF